ncbi:MAG: diguanylate cyclase [Armatimonadota bacterium]
MRTTRQEEALSTLSSTLLGTYEVLSPSIRRAYLMQIDAKLHLLQLALEALQKDPSDSARVRDVYRLFHNLAGSAGCYGFPQVTAIAQQCMRVVKEQVQAEGEASRLAVQMLSESLLAIYACFDEAREADDGLQTADLQDSTDTDVDHVEVSVLLVGAGAAETASALRGQDGFVCHYEPDSSRLEQVLRSVRPSAVVVAVGGEHSDEHSVLSAVRSMDALRATPILLIGGHATVLSELRAVGLRPVMSVPKSASADEIADLVRGAVEMRRSAVEDSSRDELTGTYNARYFREQLEREVRRARRYQHPVSLAVVEVDHLENYAAVYGAVVADSVLVAMAGFLATNLRDADLVARVNSGGFAVLMPETGLKQALKAVARNLEELRRTNLSIDQDRLQISATFSAGVSSYPANADRSEDMIEQAYDALYRAKKAGGGRVYTARRRVSLVGR